MSKAGSKAATGTAQESGSDAGFAVVHTKLAELTPDSRNANKGTARGRKLIEGSLREYGAGRSILLDKNGKIIAGNKTAATFGGLGDVPEDVIVVQTDGKRLVAVQRMDLDLDTDAAARELAIADNRAGELGLEWDTAVLADLGVDLTKFWTEDELGKLAAEPVPAPLITDEDDVPALPLAPVSIPGALYILGDHRLVCGDSTNAADVALLMDGSKATCMWTDPPYGVSYTGKTSRALTIKNDGAADLDGLLAGAFAQASEILAPGSPIYVAHPAGALSVQFAVAFLAEGWRMHQTLVWDKATLVLGHSDYHYAHEPILYGSTAADVVEAAAEPAFEPGSSAPDDSDYADAHEPILYGYTRAARRHGRGGKGWYGDNSQRSILVYPKPARSDAHPTMKPVGLVEHCLRNSTETGGIVVDLFGGSGTTLIACEKLGRRARLMEIDPRYIDVILHRWAEATGKDPIRSDGVAWSQLMRDRHVG